MDVCKLVLYIDRKFDYEIDNDMESNSDSAAKEIAPLLDPSLDSKKSAIATPHAFYRSISMPLYTLILCIILSGFLGMCMCAGFIYCGLNYCCPLSTGEEEEESSFFVGNSVRKIFYEMRKKQNSNKSNEENGKQKHRECGSSSEDGSEDDTESTDSETDDTYQSVLSDTNLNLINYEQQNPIELEVDLGITEPQLQMCESNVVKQRSD